MRGLLCFTVPPYDDWGDDEHGGVWVWGEYLDGHWTVEPTWRSERQRRQQMVMGYIRSFAECPFASVERLEGTE
jgi:hypothetical protein